MLTLIAHAQTVHEAAESSGIGALGLNVPALLFQILNFTILLLLLRFFAYKPIVKVLSDRRQRIEESLATADLIKKERAALAAEKKHVIAEARAEASTLVRQSEEAAKQLLTKTEADAEKKHQQILADAKTQAAEAVAAVRQDMKKEIVGLVLATTEKVLEEKLDADADSALITKKLTHV